MAVLITPTLPVLKSQIIENVVVHERNHNVEFATDGIRVRYDDKGLHIENLIGDTILIYPNNIFVKDYVESFEGDRLLLMLSERIGDYQGSSNHYGLLLVQKIDGQFWAKAFSPRIKSEIDYFPFKFQRKKADFRDIEVKIAIKIDGQYEDQRIHQWASLNIDTGTLAGHNMRAIEIEKEK